MLLLVTILLVVVGTISLVIGFVQSSLLPIYISIACSVLAAVVLLIFSRMTAKSQKVGTADSGAVPLDMGGPADRTQPQPAYAGTGLLAGSSGGESFAPDADRGDDSGSRHGGFVDDEAIDDDFPIERYDKRRVGEILPLLAELDLDELDIVREREEQGKSRATVLARIDQLIDQLEAEDRVEAASRFDEDDTADEIDGLPAPSAAVPMAPPPPTQAVSVAALPDDDGYFPIEDYDDLRASEILPLLPELDDDELEMVQARERSGSARSSILRRIDALLVTTTGVAVVTAPEPAPAPAPDPEPEPVVASAPPDDLASKVSAKRAAAGRKAAPAKKAAAKRTAVAPVKRASAARKAAPAKAAKTPAAATSSKAPAKKAAGRTVTPSVKKAPPAKVAAARAAAATKGGGTASAKPAKATRKTKT